MASRNQIGMVADGVAPPCRIPVHLSKASNRSCDVLSQPEEFAQIICQRGASVTK